MSAMTLALPKGRLQEQTHELFARKGYPFEFNDRELVTESSTANLKVILVKNSDLPTYVAHGIAGMGICGEDVLVESDADLYKLLKLPFGSTTMCLAGKAEEAHQPSPERFVPRLSVATKFPRFTRNYFHAQGIPVEIIKLNGSVELAPILGLAPFIVDLVETGTTLRANNLSVIQELESISVYLVANPAYYKINHSQIDTLVERLAEDE